MNRISDVGLQALKYEAGYELLEKLTALCREREGITTGQILEYFRDTESTSPLKYWRLGIIY